MRDVYLAFLRSADLPTWAECLETYSRALPTPGRLSSEELVQGLLICFYLQWLSSISGDLAAARRADEESGRFVAALTARHRQHPDAETRRGLATVLGWRGYKTAGRRLVLEGIDPSRAAPHDDWQLLPEAVGVETTLILTADDPARQAAEIRPFLTAPGTIFPPALWMYCSCLLRLGSIQQMAALLSASGLTAPQPLALDLWGQVHERSGRWQEATEAYLTSGWPAHRYRAALCATITGQRNLVALSADDALVNSLLAGFKTEIDQNEIVRSAAFANACIWNSFDNWVVDLELGKLDFRRRRYAETDAHLARALAKAPGPCRATIASLRSDNLTWLSDDSFIADLLNTLNMRPEALERTLETIDLGAQTVDAEGSRVWLAATTEDPGFLPTSVDGWAPFNQGQAHDFVGNRPEAIACWMQAYDAAYAHRTVMQLLRIFQSARFEATCEYLTDLVIRESWDDFFPLWELARYLLGVLGLYAESSGEHRRVIDRIEKTADRMSELAQGEFQHLLRVHAFFSEAGRQDIAEFHLRRAADLAEGPAECLAVAIAHRRAPWFDPGQSDLQSGNLLEQAQRESLNRLERLQIARELFYLRRPEAGRHILEQEGLFGDTQRLEHVEYVVGLQCAQWLDPREVEQIVQRAIGALDQAIGSGTVRRFERTFLRRITNTIVLSAPALSERLRRTWRSPREDDATAAGKGDGLPAGPWKQWAGKMEALANADDVDGEQKAFLAKVRALTATPQLAESLAIWCWVQDQIHTALDDVTTARPDESSVRRPINKTLTLDEDPRAVDLCDLWRQVLGSGDDATRARARSKIATLYENEEELLRRWDDLRRAKADRPRRRVLFYLEQASGLLETLASTLGDIANPVVHGLGQAMLKDCHDQRESCAALARTISHRYRALEPV